ncbi:MAG: polysaccharide biosynthesis C-terminal domain-containing protein [Bacteroidota bacterium]|nr:polysaccharide biosynthesis C-terminal domain-containing protein [Bacteroidota bacterium]
MNPLKKLASQAAIYGLPTIVGRLLNYFLTPLYTIDNFSPSEYGVLTSGYAYVTFLLVFLTYGMETALFRFSQTEPDKNKVYTTSLISIITSSSVFVLIACLFSTSISEAIKFTGHPEYVIWFAIIIGTDALTAVPFAKLREQGRAKRFAFLKTVNIAVNIGLNLFFILFCRYIYESPDSALKPFIDTIYNPEIGIGYVFISNLIASLVVLLLLLPDMIRQRYDFDPALWKRMMKYALPLLIAGMAGMINETLDRILLTWLLPEDIAMSEAGIYGACYKVSIIMTIFIQTFRFAAEPFFFSQAKEKDPKNLYALVMNYFVIICSVIFLGTMMNMEWLQGFVGEEYRVGLNVVPILLLANLFLGIFINQSIWYKLSGQTHYGALLTIFGAIITISLNIYWIPRIGYIGCAWATLICYASMMVASYFLGNKHYPVNYDLKRILGYLTLSVTLYFISTFLQTDSATINLILNNLLLVVFIGVIWKMEAGNIRKMIV